MGDTAISMGDNLSPLDFGPAFNVSAVSKGGSGLNYHHCAVSSEATFKCFGNNYVGQLGLGDESNRGDGPNEMGVSLPFVQFEFTTAQPTASPTRSPTMEPSQPTDMPSLDPTLEPTEREDTRRAQRETTEGYIIGGVIGGVLAVMVIALVVWAVIDSRKSKERENGAYGSVPKADV